MAYIITNECIMCDECVPECSEKAITINNPVYFIDPEICTDCGDCAEICPVEACVFEDEYN